VSVTVGNTITINGTMTVAAIAEDVTVVSQVPTIDLEAASVGVNWGQDKLVDLPWGKSIRGLAAMIPGMFAATYDVGGSTMGGSATLSGNVYGRTGGESRTYDGIPWSMGFDDYSSYEAIQITAAAKGAEAQNPGVTANYVVKSGGNEFHSNAYAAWEDSSFQSNNISQELLNKGFSPTGNNFTRYNDFAIDLGGPIRKNKMWFYGGYNDSYSGQHIAGFIEEKTGQPAVYYVRLNIATLKLTYQLNDKMKLEVTDQYSRKHAPYRNGDQFTPLEATQHQKSMTSIGPNLKWTYIVNPKMTTDLSFSRAGYWWPTIAWTPDVRKVDLTTTQTRGAYLANYQRPIRWAWNGSWSYFTDIAGKSNEIKSGFLGWWDKTYTRNDGYPNQQLYQYRSVAGETNYFLHPDSVLVYDYPNFVTSGVNYESWYVNDKIKLSRKLTVNAGLRYDHYSSWLPEQGNSGTGPWATKITYPENRNFPVYGSWVPRFSVAYDVLGNGTLAMKFSYGRYAGSGTNPGDSAGPGAANANPNAVITRTYTNWNGTIPYIPNPAQLASTSGGGGTQRLDTNLKSPIMDEYTAGVELGFRKDYLIKLNAVRKYDQGGNKTINLAQPFEAFTDVACAVDPGRDNLSSTADDGRICAWSVPRTYPTFGQTNLLITNVRDGEATKQYTAFELAFNKQYSNKWSALAAYTIDFARINNSDPQNPNQAAYNWQMPTWNQSVKINGSYELPLGLKWASTYQIQSGPWYGRSAQMRNALNQTVTIVAEFHVDRYPTVRLWDNRVSKTFRINEKQTIEGQFDLYNTLNASTILSQVNTNGPNYLKPLAAAGGANVASPILPARIFKLGARWRF